MKTKIGFKVPWRPLEEKAIAPEETQSPFKDEKVLIRTAQRPLVDIRIGSALPWFELTEAQGQVTAERSIW